MNKRIRQEIALKAAKILFESGQDDYLYAKKKAAAQVGIFDNKALPSNIEIESALIEYQVIFHSDNHNCKLNEFRHIAFKAMHLFRKFEPLLSGSVLNGTTHKHSEVIIHLFEDSPELIGLLLEQQQIPYRICERRLQFKKHSPGYFTAYSFLAGNIVIVAIILPFDSRRHSPLDHVTGKPMQRATINQLEKLIDNQTLSVII